MIPYLGRLQADVVLADDTLAPSVDAAFDRLHRRMGKKALKVFAWPVTQVF